MATNVQLAGKVARHVELRSITLRSANVVTDFDPAYIPDELELDVQCRSSMNRRDAVIHEGLSEPQLLVTVEFKFHARVDADGDQIEVLALDASYLLIYNLRPNAEIEEQCFKHFADVNGAYNAWPYWRELVQSVTGRVGLPGCTIPVFRPIALEVKGEDEEAGNP